LSQTRAHTQRQRPGTAAYAKGQATAAKILEVARDIVIDHGINALTMRRIAKQLDISPGNLSYYYATKKDLIEDLFSFALQGFMLEFERLRELEADSPKAQLRAVTEYVFDDLAKKETTHFFPEMWVLALRDGWAADQMERIYGLYRSVLIDILRELRPELAQQTIEDLALTICATIEGHTVFIGHGRQHQSRAPHVKRLIIEQLINLACHVQDVKESSAQPGRDIYQRDALRGA